MKTKPNIALIGCGKMGGAMLHSWIRGENVADRIVAFDPAGCGEMYDSVQLYTELEEFQSAFDTDENSIDIFIMAVKPQIMEEVCAQIKPLVGADALILSIAAGQTIASFEKRFGKKQPIIRVMPNTPAAVSKSISVAVANANVDETQKEQAHSLLLAVGLVEWLKDESLLNAVTAVSGSGPAYVFYLIETLAEAGVKAGLPETLAATLARQTVIGSAALVEAEEETPPSILRTNVTSPGGTTEAALSVLMDKENGLAPLMEKAVAKAAKRGEELG